MKATTITMLPSWLQRTLTLGLGLIVVLMPVHAFISTWGGTAIGPLWLWKSWKEILLVILAIITIGWLSAMPRRWAMLARDRLFWIILLFTSFVVVLGAIYGRVNGLEASVAGLAMDMRYVLMFGLVYVLFRFGTFNWPRVRRTSALFLIGAGTVLAFMGLVQVLFLPADFLASFGYDKAATIAPYTLIDENPDALRAFATLRGPNDFGAYLIVPLLVSLLFARRNKWFIATSLVMAAGIYASGSRSAWVGALLGIATLAVVIYGGSIWRSRAALLVAAGGIIVAIAIFIAAINIPAVRLAVFHSSPGDSSLTEGSTDKHWQATADGVMRVAAQPWGCGAGCAGPASYYSTQPRISENYYVQIAEEVGVVGLIVWGAVTVMVGIRLWRHRTDWFAAALFAGFVGLSAIGAWLHVWSDDPLSLTWWALAGMTLGYYASASGKKTVS